MALAGALEILVHRLRSLADAVAVLRLTAVVDRPAGDDLMVLGVVSDTVEEMAGWVYEGLDHALEACRLLEAGSGTAAVMESLAQCQRRVNRGCLAGVGGLLPQAALDQLNRLSRKRGGEWPGWIAMLDVGIERCREPMAEVNTALLDCWHEAANRVSASAG